MELVKKRRAQVRGTVHYMNVTGGSPQNKEDVTGHSSLSLNLKSSQVTGTFVSSHVRPGDAGEKTSNSMQGRFLSCRGDSTADFGGYS